MICDGFPQVFSTRTRLLSISQLPNSWPNTTGDVHEAYICQRASTHSDLIWYASHISTTPQIPVAAKCKCESKILFTSCLMISTGRFHRTGCVISHSTEDVVCLVPVHEIRSRGLCATTVSISVKLDSFPWQRSVNFKSECILPCLSPCGTKPCLPAFPGSKLWIVACHLTNLPKMKYAWFRCTDVSVHKQVLRLNYQHAGIGCFFSGEFRKSVLHFVTQQIDSPQRWQSLLSSVGTHEPIQGAIITRSYISASMFAFGITSPKLWQAP